MGRIFPEILRIALPCAFSGYLRSGIGMIENILVPRGLESSGLTPEQTLATMGKFEGMALPVLVFPATFLTVVSKLLVPEITAENAVGNLKNTIKTTRTTLRWTMTYAVFVGTAAALFGNALGMELYHDADCGLYLTCLAPLVPVLYGDKVIDGMMKGFNKQLTTMKINLFDTLFQTAGAWLIIPRTGIKGYAGIFCTGTVINFVLSFLSLKKTCGIQFPFKEGIFWPLMAALAALLPIKIAGLFIKIPLWVTITTAIPLFLLFLGLCTEFPFKMDCDAHKHSPSIPKPTARQTKARLQKNRLR